MPEWEAIEKDYSGDFFDENYLNSMCEGIFNWLDKYPQKTKEITNKCFEVIDNKYNPNYQIKVLSEVLKNS